MNHSVKEEAKDWIKDIVVAVVLISVVMASLYAYTGLWPPMVVIESGSMQHSDDTSYIGVIDTGDIVLSRKTSFSEITTYVEGRASGYKTYGDYGDVIIYRPLNRDVTPIIHRAVLYLEWNETTSFDAPSLKDLTYGTDYITDSGTWHGIRREIEIRDYGYESKDLIIRVDGLLRYHHSGYISAGDHNVARGYGVDQNTGICPEPIKTSWIMAKAVGELPWFGLIKLSFSGTLSSNPAPSNSWVMLFISIALLLIIPSIVEKIWDRIKKNYAEEEKESPNEGDRGRNERDEEDKEEQ